AAPEDSALRIDLVPAPLAADPSPAVLGRIDDFVKQLSGVPEDASVRHRENALLLDALIASVAQQSVLAVVDPEVSFTVDEVVAAGAIAPESIGLFGYLLRLLKQFGAASEAERVWRVSGTGDLPEIAEVWRLLLAESP